MEYCNNSLCDLYLDYDGWLSNQLEETYKTLRAPQQTINIILTAFLGTVFFIGTAGNIIVLIVFAKSKSKQTATVFIMALATTDLIICLVVLPGVLVKEWYVPFRWDALCRGWELVRCATIPLSTLILMTVAVDRYILICCVGHRRAISTQRARWILVGIVLCSVGLGIPPMLRVGVYQQGPSPGDPHQYLGLCISNDFLLSKHAADHYWQAMAAKFFLVLVIVVILYCKIFHTVYRQGQWSPGKNQGGSSAGDNSTTRVRGEKVILTNNLGPGIYKDKKDLTPQTHSSEATGSRCLNNRPMSSSLLATPVEPSKQPPMKVPQTSITIDVKEMKSEISLETLQAISDTHEVKPETQQELPQTHRSSQNNTRLVGHVKIQKLVGLKIDEQQNQINSPPPLPANGHSDNMMLGHHKSGGLSDNTVTTDNVYSHETINSFNNFNQQILNDLKCTPSQENHNDRQVKANHISPVIIQRENNTINTAKCINQCENDTINTDTFINQHENDTINIDTCINQCENTTIINLKINHSKNLVLKSESGLNKENNYLTPSQQDPQLVDLPNSTGLSIKSDQTKKCGQPNIKLFKNLKFFCKSKVHPLEQQSCSKKQTSDKYSTKRTKKHLSHPRYHISDARQKRIWSAQVKTAKVLLLVTVVYVLSFAPALLMTVDAIPPHRVPFYAYFIHSAANPIIYSFINKPFRRQLAQSLRCKQCLQ
ncbi:hypothetical protein Btru_064018 [Bulinus truncatus]|nr:hypothetical protein Btru_064018 [Bulinus truncatus]